MFSDGFMEVQGWPSSKGRYEMCQSFISMRKKDRVICLKYQIGWRNRFIASIRGSKQETGDRSGKRCDREQNRPQPKIGSEMVPPPPITPSLHAPSPFHRFQHHSTDTPTIKILDNGGGC